MTVTNGTPAYRIVRTEREYNASTVVETVMPGTFETQDAADMRFLELMGEREHPLSSNGWIVTSYRVEPIV